jgi:hypothetical protein
MMEKQADGFIVRTRRGHIEIEHVPALADPLADGAGETIEIEADQAGVLAAWLQEAKAEIEAHRPRA